MSTDIYVTGTGMVGTRQFTRQVSSAFEQSETVYLVHGQGTVRRQVADRYDATVVDLTDEYEEGGPRDATYERMAEAVLSGAADASEPVSFALYGHPMVYVSPAQHVVERAPDRGLETTIYPGISAMDCLYVDLHLDPAANGIQMFEATDLLLREFEPTPDVPLMLWQIGSVETELYSTADNAPERFTRIREYLQRFYPDDHTVYLLRTATYPFTDSQQLPFQLSEFEAMHDRIGALHTLYVPPVRERPIRNEELAELVRSRDHLQRITTDDG
ncbi:MAG: SAM-dependent methyltransferase [Halobaculum sp.]